MAIQTPSQKTGVSFVVVSFILQYFQSLLGKWLTDSLAHSVGCLPVFLSISFLKQSFEF